MGRIVAEFELDTKKGLKSKKVVTPFDDRAAAADKISDLLEKTANSSSPMMKIRDSKTGDFSFIHTMKIGSVAVYETENV